MMKDCESTALSKEIPQANVEEDITGMELWYLQGNCTYKLVNKILS